MYQALASECTLAPASPQLSPELGLSQSLDSTLTLSLLPQALDDDEDDDDDIAHPLHWQQTSNDEDTGGDGRTDDGLWDDVDISADIPSQEDIDFDEVDERLYSESGSDTIGYLKRMG